MGEKLRQWSDEAAEAADKDYIKVRASGPARKAGQKEAIIPEPYQKSLAERLIPGEAHAKAVERAVMGNESDMSLESFAENMIVRGVAQLQEQMQRRHYPAMSLIAEGEPPLTPEEWAEIQKNILAQPNALRLRQMVMREPTRQREDKEHIASLIFGEVKAMVHEMRLARPPQPTPEPAPSRRESQPLIKRGESLPALRRLLSLVREGAVDLGDQPISGPEFIKLVRENSITKDIRIADDDVDVAFLAKEDQTYSPRLWLAQLVQAKAPYEKE